MLMVVRDVAMSIVVSDGLFTIARMIEAEMRQEIAIMLFQKDKLTLAQAGRFTGMYRIAGRVRTLPVPFLFRLT